MARMMAGTCRTHLNLSDGRALRGIRLPRQPPSTQKKGVGRRPTLPALSMILHDGSGKVKDRAFLPVAG